MTHVEIITGRVCPYCGGKPELLDSAIIYRTSHGPMWICLPCQAWVGVHKDTEKPLGRLADAELREYKKWAHVAFDPLWRKKVKQGASKMHARNAAYHWLAAQMGLSRDICHIGMFDTEQCKRVIDICSPFYQTKTKQTNE
jgi:hypothetical protein